MTAFEKKIQKVFETNINFRYQGVKNLKKYRHFCYMNFKSSFDNSALIFFLISYSLVPKIEICLKYFLNKNSKKQPQWLRYYVEEKHTFSR